MGSKRFDAFHILHCKCEAQSTALQWITGDAKLYVATYNKNLMERETGFVLLNTIRIFYGAWCSFYITAVIRVVERELE